MKRLKAYISGLVQGVCFRYYTKQYAMRLGIKGYVENLWDGRVYCEAEGDEDSLQKFLEILRKGPSPYARVEHVEVEWENIDAPKYTTFYTR